MKPIKITALSIIALLAILTLPACDTTQEQIYEEKHNILLEYKPSEKIHLVVRGYNEAKEPQKTKIITSDYSIYNGITNKKIQYTHWINFDFDTRAIEIRNNQLLLTGLLCADEFYIENNKLWHASVIVYKPSGINKETLASLKNKMLRYKHRDHTDIRENEMEDLEGMPDDLLILAVHGDKEAIRLLKNRSDYNKYFNIELDGSFGEAYGSAQDEYNSFEYLRNQGGSIKEVITIDNASTASSSVR